MLHVQPLPASTRWSQTEPTIEGQTVSSREAVGQAMPAVMRLGMRMLGIAGLLVTFTAFALAQPRERENEILAVVDPSAGGGSEGRAPAFDFASWPLLDLIDARTNIAVFFRSGVPAGLRVAAFRRAWAADPAIRDFKGLDENGWDFNDPNSIPGFGELGPEVDVPTMVAQILGEPASLTALALARPDERTGSSVLASIARRLIFGVVQN